ncbi:hypothetical protein AURDEDRAFT_112472 [Auricularia subglabra TFB-10046 SS5]|nr:hypothetical protein AURDEDRAFT_112472 [Auricularia subglabra TFB-10046 SS5]
MAQPAQTLIERAEVHKSCKALEAVVNLFNDYCQAAAAAAQVEKRLAKALRDAASCKATSEPPFNALSATALVFETLSDIDNKFSKIVDKECDNVSSDLRKWFKKLAKEEKAHDDRIQAVNAKIKAAGQAYEKKSKKKAGDAVEEHTRYMNLLTAVGPEMAQDKQNHATFVTQRHNAAVCNIAASLARAADAEWSRACEGVRRVAPSIGNVTEWRAYCEGEWSGPIPADLPNLDAQDAQPESHAFVNVQAALQTGVLRTAQSSQPESPVTTRDTSSSAPSFNQPPPLPPQEPLQPPSFPSFPRPHTPESTPTLSRAQTFADTLPVPPSLPPAATSAPPSPSIAPPTAPAVAKPPAPPSAAATLNRRVSDGPPTPAAPPPAPSAAKDSTPTSTIPEDDKPPPVASINSDKPPQVGLGLEKALSPPQPFSNHTPFASDRTLLDSPAPKSPPPRGDYLQDRKVSPGGARPLPTVERQMTGIGTGIHQIQAQPTGMVAPQGTGPQPGAVHRRTSVDSTASGSIVATMRDRYGDRGMPAPASPPPRDMPRLPHSVTDMASRWNPIDAPAPRRAGVNPAQSLERDSYRTPESPRTATGARPQSVYAQQLAQSPYGRGGDSDWERDTERRRHHLQAELQALENEQRQEDQLRERERELARQQAELEHERQRLATIRGSTDDAYASRSRQNSYNSGGGYMRPPSANGSAYGSTRDPSPHRETYPSYTSSASSSAHLAAPARNAGHPPGCGCYECVAASGGGRYSNPPSPSRSSAALPVPAQPTGSVASKKGGWMRRLSMPVVGGAFSDPKKTPLASPPDDRAGKRSFDKDGVGNFGQRRDNYANANSSLTRR